MAADKKKTPGAPDKPAAKPLGTSSGISLNGTWIKVFEDNEKRDEAERWTDKQISEFMKSEFPELDSVTFDRVTIARGRYNRGGFHKKDKSGKLVKPKIHSKEHAGDDAPTSTKADPSGSAMTVKGRVSGHKKDFKAKKS